MRSSDGAKLTRRVSQRNKEDTAPEPARRRSLRTKAARTHPDFDSAKSGREQDHDESSNAHTSPALDEDPTRDGSRKRRPKREPQDDKEAQPRAQSNGHPQSEHAAAGSAAGSERECDELASFTRKPATDPTRDRTRTATATPRGTRADADRSSRIPWWVGEILRTVVLLVVFFVLWGPLHTALNRWRGVAEVDMAELRRQALEEHLCPPGVDCSHMGPLGGP